MTEELKAYITYSDENSQFPTLVVQGKFGSRGYDIDKDTGELTRVCICSAWNANECACGYWDSKDTEDYDDADWDD